MIPYNSIKTLILDHIYGGSVITGSMQELVVELLSTIGCIALVSLPFVVVFKAIKAIVG